jgi:integrase
MRDQPTYTYDTLREARAERAKIIAARATGTYVRPTKVVIAKLVADWLDGKRNLSPGTRRTYTDALQRAVDIIGHMEAQSVTKAHIDKMTTKLLGSGRRVGNVRSTALSPRSVNITLARLAAVFEDAVKQGIIGRNVVKLAERPSEIAREMQTWTAESAAEFLRHVADDRLYAAWQLSLYGLRRGEILGLSWSAVDLVAKTLTVRWERIVVADEIVEKEPKTARGRRTLPLTDDLVATLTALQLRQREEREEAGEAYAQPCTEVDPKTGERCMGDHVVVDEIGRPCHPQWYSDRFAALRNRAGLPKIRLHDARHTCGTLMHLRGVPVAAISAWLGHARASFTMDTYVHSQAEALTEASETLRSAYLTPQSESVRKL